ncbi:MAG: bacillithiol system redox-active protein YtxJ [Chitinophagaceae bacterium]|jgi:bacillithiol system protein YtxJ
MNWIPLTSEAQLEEIKELSNSKPVVIFKHSTRCSISTMAKGRLDRAEQPEGVDFYYLDLLAYRPVSNKIAEAFAVPHESPQLLLIKNAGCIYEETHNGIDMDELKAQL